MWAAGLRFGLMGSESEAFVAAGIAAVPVSLPSAR